MKRQETAYRLRIRAWTADTQRAGKHRSDILHEAAMLGVIAEILQDESYELSGEKDYRHDCHQLQMRAAEIITAVQADRYEQARVSARKSLEPIGEEIFTDFRCGLHGFLGGCLFIPAIETNTTVKIHQSHSVPLPWRLTFVPAQQSESECQ